MLVVQNNSGLENADSYVSVAELEDYTAKRGITLISDAEVLLIKAMDYIEAKTYNGLASNKNQSTLFPRAGSGVPVNIKKAQMALAVIADTTELMPNHLPNDMNVVGERVEGAIDIKYEVSKKAGILPLFSYPDSLLAPFLWVAGGVGLNIGVQRG